jgi:phospholipid/cholesterol/gamma-HCH transport system substrate-binding protein
MNESPNRRAIFVGIFVLLGIVFLLAGVLTIGNLHTTFSRKISITTRFDDVNGLQPGNNIWFSGVRIGTVKKLRFFGTSQVEVIMNIDEKAQQYVRKDAKVKVSTDGLIGNKILVIYGGSASAAEVEPGDTLGVEVAVSTEDMMNTFQENNKNVLAITNDFKILSKKMANGEGTMGKLLTDESVYNNMNATIASLKNASERAQAMMNSLSGFTAKLNKKGTLANDLVTDTVMFNSMRASINQLHHIADTASVFISDLKQASANPKSSVGVLLHDEQTAANLKATMQNLESGSKKLDQDLEALQHNFLLRKYFRKQEKEKKQ